MQRSPAVDFEIKIHLSEADLGKQTKMLNKVTHIPDRKTPKN